MAEYGKKWGYDAPDIMGNTSSFQRNNSFKDRWNPMSDFNRAARSRGTAEDTINTESALKSYGQQRIDGSFPSQGEVKGSHEGSQSDTPSKDNP